MRLLSLFLILAATVGSAHADVHVILETDLGEIEIAVDTTHAPVSAGSFLEFVDRGLYEGASFYRTVRPDNDNGSPIISVIQGGVQDPSISLPPVAHETTEDTGILHTDGVVSLARSEPGTASGAAFFICIGDQPSLDFGGTRNPDRQGFAAFGRVLSGMDVVHAIHREDASAASDSDYTKGQILTRPIRIRAARRVSAGAGTADN